MPLEYRRTPTEGLYHGPSVEAYEETPEAGDDYDGLGDEGSESPASATSFLGFSGSGPTGSDSLSGRTYGLLFGWWYNALITIVSNAGV